jgi:hypothetical protein
VAKTARGKETDHPLLNFLSKTISLLSSGVKPWIHHLREGLDGQLDHYAQIIEKRLVVLGLFGVILFLSILFIWFGFLFIAIDYGGIPRAFACLSCGSFGLIVLLLIMSFEKRTRKV